ncbi:hypothetical protein [Bradyrhizobium sp. USDA 3315]
MVDRIVSFFTRVAERSIYPIIRWMQRLRRKRVVASLLVLFAVVGSLYSYADAIYQFVNKALVVVGFDNATNRERRITLLRSYQLGKSLAQNITYTYRRNHGEHSDFLDSQITSTAAMTNSIAAQLGFSLEVQKLHTQPVLSTTFWDSSPGVRFIRESVKTAKGAEAEIAFDTGFNYSIFEHRTNRGEYNPFEFMVTFPEEIDIGLRPATVRLKFPDYKKVRLKMGDGKSADQVREDNKDYILMSLFDWDREVRREFAN